MPTQNPISMDIVSNSILVQALQSPDGVQQLLRDELPASLYPAYAHEVTHHWCFLSPIGAVIALLYAQSDVALWRAKTKDEVVSANQNRMIADTLKIVHRPVAEGIALFAELNMRMSVSGLSVEPCEWVTQHLIRLPPDLKAEMRVLIPNNEVNLEEIPDNLYERFVVVINAFLDEARLSQSQVDSRRRLSMRQLDNRDGGYLAGYLLIKRGYNHLLRHGTQPVDANSFLAFAKAFFFHDTVLALGSLNGTLSDQQSIIRRMNERLQRFDSQEIVDMFAKFVNIAEHTPRATTLGKWTTTYSSAIDVPSSGDEAVFSKMRDMMDAEGALATDANFDLASSTINMRIQSRDLLNLGVLDGKLSTTWMHDPAQHSQESWRVIHFVPEAMDSLIILRQRSEQRFDEVSASLELLFWSTANRLILTIYVGLELIGLSLIEEGLSEQHLQQLYAILEERQATKQNIEAFQSQAKVALEHVFQNSIKDIVQRNQGAINQMLAERLFPNHPQPETLFALLKDRGFFKLYDTSERAEQFANLCATLASGKIPTEAIVKDTLNWSAQCETQTGWSMLETSGEHFLTAL